LQESNGKTSYYNALLDIGVYFCYAKIMFDSEYEKECDVNLGIYGDYACKIDFATH